MYIVPPTAISSLRWVRSVENIVEQAIAVDDIWTAWPLMPGRATEVPSRARSYLMAASREFHLDVAVGACRLLSSPSCTSIANGHTSRALQHIRRLTRVVDQQSRPFYVDCSAIVSGQICAQVRAGEHARIKHAFVSSANCSSTAAHTLR
jgi:hypothetical protein